MSKWIKSTDKQPNEGDRIKGKILNKERIITVTITGNFWDYGISEWKLISYLKQSKV